MNPKINLDELKKVQATNKELNKLNTQSEKIINKTNLSFAMSENDYLNAINQKYQQRLLLKNILMPQIFLLKSHKPNI